MAKITAVIDIGSNSARMAIFQKSSRFGFHLILETKSRVRISEDCYQNLGNLQAEPIKRAINALEDFLFLAKENKAKKIFCVATSAVRDAPNRTVFIQKAKKLGLNIKPITGEKEAYFGALAALNLLPYRDGITLDIGGGSTECALIQEGKIEELISLKLGTIRLKELFLDKKDLKGAVDFIQENLAKLPKKYKQKRCFGIGGTARALGKMIQKVTDYPISELHAYSFSFKEHKELLEKIPKLSPQELLDYGIKSDRLDSIVGGAMIFTEALKTFNTKEAIISGVGVREGVFLHDLLRNQKGVLPKNCNPSVRSLSDRFDLQKIRSKLVKTLALQVFTAIQPYYDLNTAYKLELGISAELSNIGTSLDFYDNSEHTSYILLNGLNYGLTHSQKALIALLTKGEKKLLKSNLYTKLQSILPPLDTIKWLGICLQLAKILSEAKNAKDFKVSYKHNTQTLLIHTPKPPYLVSEKISSLSSLDSLKVIFVP